jgi:hypothetical protein
MKNATIISHIKSSTSMEAIEALASKYGLTIEQANEIAETIIAKKVTYIKKQVNNWTGLGEILVGWKGSCCGMGYTSHTRFVIGKNGEMWAYGK